MEHYNPILGSEPNGQKFITCGEIMLRLTPPNYEKIRMASSFEASYGGSEANIALALANLGVDSTFFSVVPNNSLGKSAVRWLRSNDVHCTPMILTEPNETPSNRLGTYYLETGYGIRASKVIYDRKHSAITEYDFSQVDLDALLDGYDWLHLSGITPALGPNCRGLIIDMLKVAKKKGLTVSFDGNFRSTLWSWEEARDFCTECLPYVDVLLGIEPYHLWKDDSDHSKGDWKDGVPLQPSYEQQDEIFQHFIARYPNLKCIARHVRYAHSGSENSLKAFMWYDGHTFESKLYTFNILDRVGGGDAFASGLIYAMLHDYRAMDMINFAVASSAIKKIEQLFGEYLWNTISIRDTAVAKEKKENFYHGILLGLLGYKANWLIKSNAESGTGYSDILVEVPNNRTGIVIELKYAGDGDLDAACAEALKQMEEKSYVDKLKQDGMRNFIKYGIACFKKDCRVVIAG